MKKVKRRKRGLLIRLLLGIVRYTGLFVIGFTYTMYLIVKGINNLVARLFMKLPRLVRVITIYLLIATAIYGQINVKTIIKEVVKEEELIITIDKDDSLDGNKIVEVLEPVSNEQNTKLNGIALEIYKESLEQGLSIEQAYILVAISRHETGNWTSNAFKIKNNFGGIMCNTGLRTYNSLDEGLNAFVKLLKNNYFGKGLNTIEQIGAKYCPIGASNDPTGVNIHWVPNVTKYYNEYIGG